MPTQSPTGRPRSESSSPTSPSSILIPLLHNLRLSIPANHPEVPNRIMDLTYFLADSPPTVVPLAIKQHFGGLSREEKGYAHCISRAAFNGSRIILRQVSPESESIFDLIIALYAKCQGKWDELAKEASVSAEDLKYFLEYAAQFLGNLGNYKGFGDVKFIPRCPKDTFSSLASVDDKATTLCKECVDAIYADESKPGLMHLGFPDKGHMTTYYPDSPNITQTEIETVDKYIGDKGLLPENTRIRKTPDGNFEILIASGISHPPANDQDTLDTSYKLPDGKKVSLVFGDHREQMAKIALHMKRASTHGANPTQKSMMDAYAKSFGTGSLLAFKESQKLWVKDLGPAVESNIGFIETYRDPAGVRGEWEGFVATVNLERTASFKKLVDAAPEMLPKLPWGAEFEKDVFVPPDFTSLEVLSFASSGIPAGINIPNHDDIRQNHGFKNVSLGNVLSAKSSNEPIPFIHPSDLDCYTTNRDAAFEVQVGIHELLGHGSGKLLQETSPGVFNFDHQNPPLSPLTGKPCTTYYKPSETYSTLFAALSSSYEECRAECVAMALSCDFGILSLFGFGSGSDSADMAGKAGDVLYASYLSMARAGIVALEFWDPKAEKWGQAHMQARFSILKTFLRAGEGFCWIDVVEARDDGGGVLADLTVRIDRSKILTVGRRAVEAYLQNLHVFKATADLEAGKRLYGDMTRVQGVGSTGENEDGSTFWAEKVRDLVLKRKVPRKVFVQANTVEDPDGEVRLVEYEDSVEGMIRSWAERDV